MMFASTIGVRTVAAGTDAMATRCIESARGAARYLRAAVAVATPCNCGTTIHVSVAAAAATAKAGMTRRRSTPPRALAAAAGNAAGASTCASALKRSENEAMNALLRAGLTARSSERNASPIR